MNLGDFKGKRSFEIGSKRFATQDNLEENPIYKEIIVDKAAGFVPSSQFFTLTNESDLPESKTLDLSKVVGKNEAFVLFSVFTDEEEFGVHSISVRPADLKKVTMPTTKKDEITELIGGCSTIYLGDGGLGGHVSTATNKKGEIEIYMPKLKINISMIGYIPMIEQ